MKVRSSVVFALFVVLAVKAAVLTSLFLIGPAA